MKIAVLSDIHGNLPALNTVLKDIHLQQIDEIIFLGDLTTIGPQPKEVIEKIRSLNCTCIMGNHDAALLDRDNLDKYQIAPLLHSSLSWCFEQLDENDLIFLQDFKPIINKSISSDIDLLFYHGSPESNTDIILSTTEESVFEFISDYHTANIFIGGHTHLQMKKKYKDKLFINSGSVGSAFPRFFMPGETPTMLQQAEYAILNMEAGKVDIIFRQIPFDTDCLKNILSQSDIPIKEWWLEQYN